MINPADLNEYGGLGAAPLLDRQRIAQDELNAIAKSNRTFQDNLGIINDSVDANLQLHTPFFSAAYQISNSVQTNYEILNGAEQIDPLDPQYVGMADIEYFDKYLRARTDQEWHRIDNQIKHEKSLEEREGSFIGGAVGLVGIALTDPGSYIPMASILKASSVAQGFTKGFVKAIPGALAGGAISEGAQLLTQETRTAEETAYNIGLQTLLGAALGGGIGVYAAKKTEQEAYKHIAAENLKGNEVRVQIDESGKAVALNSYSTDGDSVGAMLSSKPIDYKGDRLVGANEDTSKWHPGRFFLWATGKLTQNPVIKGLMSPSKVTAKFTNEIVDHNLDTVGTVMGQNRPRSIQTKLRKYDTLSMQASSKIRANYFEYLGLDPKAPLTNEIRNKLLSPKEGQLTEIEFNRQSIIAAVSPESYRGDSFVKHKARELWDEYLGPIQKALVDDGVLGPEPPTGAEFWLGRIHDKEYITNNRLKVTNFYKDQYIQTNEKIIEATKGLSNAEAKLDRLRGLGVDESSSEFKLAKKAVAREKKLLDDRVLKDEFDDDMVVGNRGQTYDEIQALKKLRKPITALKKEIAYLKKNLSVATEKANPGRLPGQPNNVENEVQRRFREEIEIKELELKEARKEIDILAHNKQIPESFTYFHKQREIHYLKKPNKGDRKLRSILDDDQLTLSANNTVDNILKSNVAQMAKEMVGAAKSGGNGITNIQRRADMTPDHLLYENNILIGDIHSVIRTAIKQSGQLLEWNRYLKGKGWKGGDESHLDFLARAINEDYDDMFNALFEKHGGTVSAHTEKSGNTYYKREAPKDAKEAAKLDKEVARLQKHKESDVENVQDMYRRQTNGYDKSMKKTIQVMDISNKFAYSTQLGLLVAAMAGESVAIAYRTGLVNFVKGVKTYFGKNNGLSKTLARDIGLGIETEQAAMMINLGLEVDNEVPVSALQRKLGKTVNVMSLLNFSAPVSDLFNRIATVTSASSFIRNLEKFAAGKISKNGLADLALYGLAEPADRDLILKAFKKYGDDLNGGKLPNWTRWNQTAEDMRASQLLADAVAKKVKSVLFSGPHAASFPSGVDPNGPLRSFFIYTGWILQANMNYFLPLVQRLDPQKAAGVAAIIGMSMFTEPLRQLANGDEVDLEPGHLFGSGILNAGVGGIFLEAFNKANAMGNFIPELVRDKDKGRGISIGVGGSLVSLFENGFRFASEAAHGELNQADLKRQLRATLPLVGALPFRPLIGAAVNASDLPETRAEAKRQNR